MGIILFVVLGLFLRNFFVFYFGLLNIKYIFGVNMYVSKLYEVIRVMVYDIIVMYYYVLFF